jgi:uncharacterized protein (TIGR02452 family)
MWTRLATLDSDARAEALQRRLNIPRDTARELGHDAVRITRSGLYTAPSGAWVDIGAAVARAVRGTRSVPPDEALPAASGTPRPGGTVQVQQVSSQDAAQALNAAGRRTLILNFANGIRPGGGFLNGARAQEECLARSSALFATLDGDPMYEAHAARPLPDSTAWAILSPDVPFFRTEDGVLLEQPWTASVLTCAAPVATRLPPGATERLMPERIGRVLDIAAAYGFDGLVLGAWGCGAFGNDPALVARQFADALDARAGAFAQVVFAISDWSPERRFLGPFRDVFAP